MGSVTPRGLKGSAPPGDLPGREPGAVEEALVPGEYEEPYCSVACAGSSPAEARHRLLGPLATRMET